jgi:hypothetical protein
VNHDPFSIWIPTVSIPAGLARHREPFHPNDKSGAVASHPGRFFAAAGAKALARNARSTAAALGCSNDGARIAPRHAARSTRPVRALDWVKTSG